MTFSGAPTPVFGRRSDTVDASLREFDGRQVAWVRARRSSADVAVLELREGTFEFVDTFEISNHNRWWSCFLCWQWRRITISAWRR